MLLSARADTLPPVRYRGPDRRAGASPGLPTTRRTVLADVAVVAALAVLGPLVTYLLTALDLGTDTARVSFGIITAALAATAGLTGALTAELNGDAAMNYLGPAALVYGGLLVPMNAVATTSPALAGVLSAAKVAGALAVAVLAVAALRGPAIDSQPRGWLIGLGVSGLLTVVAGILLTAPATVTPTLLDRVMPSAWLVVGATYAISGLRRRRLLFWRFGLGFGAVAVGQILHQFAPASLPTEVLRLIGVGMCAFAMLPELLSAMRTRRRREEAMRLRCHDAEELASHAADVAAEHRHEIRNALTGIAGATDVLVRHQQLLEQDEREHLGTAVQSQLVRLQRLVAPPPPAGGTHSGSARPGAAP